MVQSGLAADDVSPLWLAFHLTLGLATLGYVTVLARSLAESRLPSASRGMRVMAAIIMVFGFLQVFYGGLMAGLDAGLIYDTWPMMDGQFVPARLLFEGFQVANLLYDRAMVQFVHRMLAYVLLLLVLVHLIQAWRTEFAAAAFAVLWLVGSQAILGILTLLLRVPVPIALLHQFGAILVVFSSVLHWRAMSPPLPLPAHPGG
jgi:cytochrome c oxidase assembly protein subunit 15